MGISILQNISQKLIQPTLIQQISILDNIDYASARASYEIWQTKRFDYPCPDNYEKIVDNLFGVRGALIREALREKYGECCINIEEDKYQPWLFPNTPLATGVDKSKEEGWILENPMCSCIRKEKWEQCAVDYCKKMGLSFSVKNKEEACNLAFEIKREIVDPCVTFAISISTKASELGYEPNRTEEECKIDYKILVEEEKCPITYKTYVKAVSEGLTWDIIKLIYDNKLELVYENNRLALKTKIGEYVINDLVFNSNLSEGEIRNLISQDPKEFVRKYLSDYNLKEADIIKILS